MGTQLIFFVLVTVTSTFIHAVVVPTQHGPVQGIIRITETGRNYFSFQGIPYARAPDGHLRFRDPLPPISWTAPLNCTVEGPQFWGINSFTGQIEGSFDALHVNVFTNQIQPSSPYPVLVWIHGGAYRSGSATTKLYAPDYLVEKDVVVVSINYRLAAFGFLSLDDPSLQVPGNAGMKDQRLALRWVQQNIANFGGDPTRVVVFGHSAGGGSAHYQLISENSRGLVSGAMGTGSNALQNIVSYIPRLEWARRLAAQLGFESTSESAILSFLENANPIDIVREQENLLLPETSLLEGYANAFGPTKEPYITDGVFLYKELSEHLQNAWGNDINLMLGATSFENLPMLMMIRDDPMWLQILGEFEVFIPRDLGVAINSEKARKYAQMIKKNYYPVLKPTTTNCDGLMLASSDMDLWYGIHRSVRYRLRSGRPGATYVLRFDADTENSVFKRQFNDIYPNVKIYREPIHGDEFAYFFKTIYNKPKAEMSPEGLRTLELMVTMLVNFAGTGNPSIPEMNIVWPRITSEHELLMGLNVNENISEVMVFPESDRMPVFDEIFEMERNNTVKLSSVI